MIKITRGGKTRTVTSGAFESLYKSAGWKKVTDESRDSGTGNPPVDPELASLRERAKELKISRASQMGKEKLLAAIAAKEADGKSSGTGNPPVDLADDELLEIPVGEMTVEQLERAAEIIGYDYKADGVTIDQLSEKLAEKLAAR